MRNHSYLSILCAFPGTLVGSGGCFAPPDPVDLSGFSVFEMQKVGGSYPDCLADGSLVSARIERLENDDYQVTFVALGDEFEETDDSSPECPSDGQVRVNHHTCVESEDSVRTLTDSEVAELRDMFHEIAFVPEPSVWQCMLGLGLEAGDACVWAMYRWDDTYGSDQQCLLGSAAMIAPDATARIRNWLESLSR
jgi:hypothetical protein